MMLRPEAQAALLRWREVIAGGLVVAVGLWIATAGGWLMPPLGLLVAALGAGWSALAARRLRFAPGVGAPGMVEVDEGQVGYLGPAFGGFVSLPDLVELRLLTMGNRQLWRLKQEDGQALLIPVDAAGGDRLYDAFASLPGMDTGRLVASLSKESAPAVTGTVSDVIWRREGIGRLAG